MTQADVAFRYTYIMGWLHGYFNRMIIPHKIFPNDKELHKEFMRGYWDQCLWELQPFRAKLGTASVKVALLGATFIILQAIILEVFSKNLLSGVAAPALLSVFVVFFLFDIKSNE